MKRRGLSRDGVHGLLRGWLAALSLAASFFGVAGEARAWDPSTTHLGMLERSVGESQMHLRWMEASLLQRGLFSPVRLDPAQLDDETRRLLILAMRNVHAASGAQPLGGPGSCPGASAPASTRAHCVDGDRWELTALGWLELGIVVETVPAERLLHHFVNRSDAAAPHWSDDDLPRSLLRSKHAKAGASLAERLTGKGFEGSGRSAVAWLGDAKDRWAPPALSRHLRRASLAKSPAERDHHLVLALLCTGALLHVVQDLSVPAHARGDVSAMFLPLSETVGDRGLPLQELARVAYGRGSLPRPLTLSPRATAEDDDGVGGVPLASTLRGHVLGEGEYPGLVYQAGRTFLSESTLPRARHLDAALDPREAATILLEGIELDAAERDGARLSQWPAERGYLLGASGRFLAAFRVDDDDQIRLWIDRRVYRAQMQELIPAGIEAGRSMLDLLYSAWPEMSVDVEARELTLTPGSIWRGATLIVLLEDGAGKRSVHSEVALRGAGTHRVVDAWPTKRADDGRVVLVLVGPEGQLPAVVEQVLDLDVPEVKVTAPKVSVPRPRAGPTMTRPRGTTPQGTPPAVAMEPDASLDDASE